MLRLWFRRRFRFSWEEFILGVFGVDIFYLAEDMDILYGQGCGRFFENIIMCDKIYICLVGA